MSARRSLFKTATTSSELAEGRGRSIPKCSLAGTRSSNMSSRRTRAVGPGRPHSAWRAAACASSASRDPAGGSATHFVTGARNCAKSTS